MGTQVSKLKPSCMSPEPGNLMPLCCPGRSVSWDPGSAGKSSQLSLPTPPWWGQALPGRPGHRGASRGWVLFCPGCHLPERCSASSWKQECRWARRGGVDVIRVTGYLLWSWGPAAFLPSGECWSLKFCGQGFLGKCFHYGDIRLTSGCWCKRKELG